MPRIIITAALIVLLLASCTPTNQGAANSQGDALPSTGEIPPSQPPGLNRGLTGRLVLIQYHPEGNRLLELNLTSGQVQELFKAPNRSWLSEAVVSPAGDQILLTYAAPPPDNTPQFGFTDFYLLTYRGVRTPRPFLLRTEAEESFFHPAWSPDGQSIYYTRLYHQNPDERVPRYQNDIEQITLNGDRRTVLPHALWPAVSPDGTTISYLTADETGLGNDLYIASADGSSPTPVLKPGAATPVDAHLFTADGTSLVFSMVNPPEEAPASWMQRFFGVQTVRAHNVPSDWYSMPIQGGEPQRLTNLNDLSLSGDISPDGKYMAFISATGLYMMDLESGEVFQVWADMMVGTVDWIP